MNKIVFLILKDDGVIWFFVSKEEHEKENIHVFKNPEILQRKLLETKNSITDFRKLCTGILGNAINAIQHGFYGRPVSQKSESKFLRLLNDEKELPMAPPVER